MLNRCEPCNKNYSTKHTFAIHLTSKLHQKNTEDPDARPKLKPTGSNELFTLDVYHNEEFACKTIVNEEIYCDIVNNNYSLTLNRGYVAIQVKGRYRLLSHYIYYTFYGNSRTPGYLVDHRNCNKLDNRIENYREATALQNALNRSKCKKATSKYHGVSRGSKTASLGAEKGGWQCQMKHDGAQYNFFYTDELHAAYHYDLLVKQFNLQEFKPLNGIEKPVDFVLKVPIKKKDDLPKNIRKREDKYGYEITINKKHIRGPTYTTIEEAVAALNKVKADHAQAKEAALLSEPIKRNSEGIAIIELFNKKKGDKREKTGEALVSDEDYYNLRHYKWYMRKMDNYVVILGTVNNKTVRMSRFIMNYNGEKMVDHDNSNTLDHRRSNLRIATAKQNAENKSSLKGSSSPFVGVSYDKRRNKWKAAIKIDGKTKNLGRYENDVKAAIARDKEIIRMNTISPTFHKLNFTYYVLEGVELVFED